MMIKKQTLLIPCVLLMYSFAVGAEITHVSVSSDGTPANSFTASTANAVSADGRIVVFDSDSETLLPDDTSYHTDVFAHDRQTGITKRVSVSSSGEQGRDRSENPAISANGRFVVFTSLAENLVSDDFDFKEDVFVHDLQTGTTERVGFDTTGDGLTAVISADGRYVAYESNSINLVPDDTNGWQDIFVIDRQTGVTERVSVTSSGAQAIYGAFAPSISADGRFVAFASYSDNFIVGDTNQQSDIFVHDRQSGTTELVSISSNGELSNNASERPIISADGRFITFTSRADNLVSGNNFGSDQIYVHDRQTRTTELASISMNGQIPTIESIGSSISGDGRFVAYRSLDDTIVPGDDNAYEDVFVYDRDTGRTERVSLGPNGADGDGNSGRPAPSISEDGSTIVFWSTAGNLTNNPPSSSGVYAVENPLRDIEPSLITVEKLINHSTRETPANAAQLATGTQYRHSYKVTNNSSDRLYQVQVFEDGNFVCNFYTLKPGQTKQRCESIQTVLNGDQRARVMVTAKQAGTSNVITSTTDAYYLGLSNVVRELNVTHYINNRNADEPDQAPTVSDPLAKILFKVENTGMIEMYRVKLYHHPVLPVNSGWEEMCVIGTLKPGQVRYCKRDISITESGLNYTVGIARGANAIIYPTEIRDDRNTTYFVVP